MGQMRDKVQEIVAQMGVNAQANHGMYGRQGAGNNGIDGSQFARQSWHGKGQVNMVLIVGMV
jgi:hypothetical protein